MKKLEMMKGLLAGKPRQNLAQGGMSLTDGAYQPTYTGGLPATAANINGALVNNPGAGNIGLAPINSAGGNQFQTSGLDQGPLAGGAALGAAQQNNLSGMLMNQAQGGGPSPAQMMLNQATGQNVAQTGALMASQRGAQANPALIARQAAMAGANLQQNAAGQAATLGAEQQLAAQQQLAGLSSQQVGQQLAQNQQNIAMQGNINSTNGQQALAAQEARAKQFGGTQQGLGAAQAANSQGTGNDDFYAPNQINTGPGSIAGTPGSGGINAASGGMIGPRSLVGRHLAGLAMAQGGKVPAMVSPGEIYLPPSKAAAVAKGKASPASGEKIKGKAKVSGDSLKNDTVKKTLDEGGVVVPRTKASDMDKAAAFVRAVMSKSKRR